jgi:hypothetical protein
VSPLESVATTLPATVPLALFSLMLKLWLLTTGAQFLPGPLAAKASPAIKGISKHTANSMMLAWRALDKRDFEFICFTPVFTSTLVINHPAGGTPVNFSSKIVLILRALFS